MHFNYLQGGAVPEAEQGVQQLSDELRTYIQDYEETSMTPMRPWKVLVVTYDSSNQFI